MSETETKYCSKLKCHATFHGPNFHAQALSHWVEEHPNTTEVEDILGDIEIKAECGDCGEMFIAPVHHTAGQLYRPAYCDDCVERDPVKQIMGERTDSQSVIREEVELEGGEQDE